MDITRMIIRFNEHEVPLCPNDYGLMYMDAITFSLPTTIENFKILVSGINALTVPEARAWCLVCKYTMLVADERDFDNYTWYETPLNTPLCELCKTGQH